MRHDLHQGNPFGERSRDGSRVPSPQVIRGGASKVQVGYCFQRKSLRAKCLNPCPNLHPR